MINGRELDLLVETMHGMHAGGEVPGLVTLLEVKGSAYRRPGSKMLVGAGGETTCMISGGCLEPELAVIAREAVSRGETRRVKYDLSEDEIWGLGLGCGGTIDLLIEPAPAGSMVAEWVRAQASGTPAVSATMVSARHPERRMFRADSSANLHARNDGEAAPEARQDGRPGEDNEGGSWAEIERRAGELLAHGEEASRVERVSGDLEVFFDVSIPRPELLLFGGGPDAVPLASYAAKIGFRVTVVDPREDIATQASFPEAELVRAQPEQFAERVSVTAESYVVVMNHHVVRDRESLVFALSHSPAYVGVMGPARRFERLLEELDEEGRRPPATRSGQVHNPVGLDIGAEGPEEVALSVLSEILMVRRGHTGLALSGKQGGIHERTLRTGAAP